MTTPEMMHFKIQGMDCAEEVAVLKREVGPVVGGEERLGFDILNGRMTVTAGSPDATPESIRQAVSRTGMQAEIWRKEAADLKEDDFWRRRGRIVLTAVSGLLTVTGFFVQVWTLGGLRAALGGEGLGGQSTPLAARVLYSLGIVAGGWYVFPKAWLAARRLRPDMNLLMTVAIVGAVAIGEWLEGATVAFLFALSLALESWSVGRARRAVGALLELAPATARLQRGDGSEEQVAPEQVPVGGVRRVAWRAHPAGRSGGTWKQSG
jgi:Cd2+/Zn2+-exporting ATPase